MGRLLLFAVILGVALSALAAPFQNRRDGAAGSAITVGEVNADQFKNLLKREGKVSRPLLVNFWATWCDPCRDEFPDLVKLDEEYRAKGLEFVAISLDDPRDIKTKVPQFLSEMHAKMPVFLLNVPDPEVAINAVDREWSGALPATFLYDTQGTVVFKYFGRVKIAELRAAIKKVMSDE
jgi:thiol-disulfide isomerase/thioredoxin